MPVMASMLPLVSDRRCPFGFWLMHLGLGRLKLARVVHC
jgi:hypothetical protein